VIRISSDDLSRAQPLTPAAPRALSAPDFYRRNEPRTWNRLALIAMLLAVLGLPVFLFLAGLSDTMIAGMALAAIALGVSAVLVGCLSLVGRRPRQRGVLIACGAVLMGLGDLVGSSVGVTHHFGWGEHAPFGRHAGVPLENFELDPSSFEGLPEPLARCLKANVLIQTGSGWNGLEGMAIGSGVVLRIEDGTALVVTNRHVVDPHYTGTARAKDDLPEAQIRVRLVNQKPMISRVAWVAPDGIDLALVKVPITEEDAAEAAHWDRVDRAHVGEKVFVIGNPHGLAWTHTAGDVSQIRKATHGAVELKLIQTSAAINPGNSGGGLYDEAGQLLGIVTYTQDKRFAEGLGFAISLQHLRELAPPEYGLAGH
jgi:hypothetical protein